MIIAVCGDIGSGKSVSVVRNIVRSGRPTFCNFDVKTDNCIRLKKTDIVMEKDGKYAVNWEFWENARRKCKNFDIVIDEVQNIFHSRQSMHSMSIQASKWISQIRKVLFNSTTSNIYLISQRVTRIDVAWRDLIQYIIQCVCIMHNGQPYIMQYHFKTDMFNSAQYKHEAFLCGARTWDKRTAFYPKPYFKYYNTYEILTESDWL